MDARFNPTVTNTPRDFQVKFYPTSDIRAVRLGTATDGVDWSPWVSSGTQSATGLQVTLSFNQEFLGASTPQPGQTLACFTLGLPLWIGYIKEISTYSVSYGQQRTMNIAANSREQWDAFKLVKRVSQLYPLLTNLNQIIQDVGVNVGLYPDEILFPPTSIYTTHSSTQLANISTWEMIQEVSKGLGVTPVIDSIGRLRALNRDVQFPQPDYIMGSQDIQNVSASRNRPSTTRYVLTWLDPGLTQILQPQRLLAQATVTPNIISPYIYHDVYYSQDKTQRATGTTMITKVSCNQFLGIHGVPLVFLIEVWHPDTDTKGRIEQINPGWFAAMILLWGIISGSSFFSSIPGIGGLEGTATVIAMALQLSIGTGDYEIWGNPYDWGHAKNTSEAYDLDAIAWLDNPEEAECDFIMDEAHAQATCTRELIYLSKSANTWSASIRDDFRIERGDVIGFPDGSNMYVLDYSRDISRDTPNVMKVSGFLI